MYFWTSTLHFNQFSALHTNADPRMKYSKALTSQNLAPYLGGGESQNLYRFLVPPAQVVEHGVHSLQLPHFPVSVSETKLNSFFLVVLFKYLYKRAKYTVK